MTEAMMEPDSISVLGFVVGLVSAAGLYVLNDQLTQLHAGRRFRRRVSDDIRFMLAAYCREFRSLLATYQRMQSQLGDLETGKRSRFGVEYIWDDSSNPMDQIELQQHMTHLDDHERRWSLQFYGAVGRMGEVREEYNRAVTAVLQAQIDTTEGPEDFARRQKRYMHLLLGLRKDFESQMLEAVGHGSNALKAFSGRHGLRRYRRPYYDRLAHRLRKARERAELASGKLKLDIPIAQPPESTAAAALPSSPDGQG